MNSESQIKIPSNVCLSLKGGYVRVLGPLGESKIKFLTLDPKGKGRIRKLNPLSDPKEQKGGTFLLSFIEENRGEIRKKDCLKEGKLCKRETNNLFSEGTLLSEKEEIEKFLKKVYRKPSLNTLESHHLPIYRKLEKKDCENGLHISSEKQNTEFPNHIKRGTYKEVLKKIVSNKIQGVSSGFALTLKIKGVGFRVKKNQRVASGERQSLFFKMGYSHQVEYQLPESVFAFVFQQTVFCLFGLNKNQVSQVAHKIQEIREADIYKGKGIRFADQEVKIKEGKRK